MKVEKPKRPINCPLCQSIYSMKFALGQWYCPFCIKELDDALSMKIKEYLMEQQKYFLEQEQKRIELEEKKKEEEKQKREEEYKKIEEDMRRRNEEEKIIKEELEKRKQLYLEKERKESEQIFENNIKYFYHLTSINNLSSILKNGLLSNNEVKKRKLIHDDMSLEDCQKRRDERKIYLSDGISRDLHDLIPFYFVPKTPSNHNMYMKNKKVVMICVNKKIVNSDEYVFAFSNGNLASPVSNYFSNLIKLNQLDWNILEAEFYGIDYLDPEIRRRRMAEVLIFPNVKQNFIQKIIAPTNEIKEEVNMLIKQFNILNIVVEHDRSFFG